MEGGILPSRKELLSRIELVCELDSSFIAVTGETGIGKTALLEFFIEHHCPQHKKCFIHASGSVDAEQLKEQVLLQLISTHTMDSRLSLAQNLAAFDFGEPQNIIIIIDDAHCLDVSAFDELIELLKSNIERFRVSVIFAHPLDQDRFAQLNARHPLIEMHIEPLSKAESRLLLEFYYRQMLDGDRAEVQLFIDRCSGNPGQLLKWNAEPGAEPKPKSLNTRMVVIGIAAFLLVGVLGAASWYFVSTAKDPTQMQVETLRKKVAQEVEQQKQEQASKASLDTMLVEKWDPEAQQPKVEQAKAAAGDKDEVSDVVAEEFLSTDKSTAEQAQVADASPKEDRVAMATEEAVQTAKNPLKDVQNSTPQSAATQKPVVQKSQPQAEDKGPEPASLKAEKTRPSLLDDKDNRWFLSQQDNQLVLQLTGASSEKVLNEFLQSYKLGNEVHTYRAIRQGKPWFVVTYGLFSDFEQANAAKAQLPASLRKGEPWAKSIRAIKTEILDADKQNQ